MATIRKDLDLCPTTSSGLLMVEAERINEEAVGGAEKSDLQTKEKNDFVEKMNGDSDFW